MKQVTMIGLDLVIGLDLAKAVFQVHGLRCMG
jgi:hypothetical protein